MRRPGCSIAVMACALSGACAGDDPVSTEPPSIGRRMLRFHTAPIEVGPGEGGLWAQFVAAPMDRALDVYRIAGEQSVGGHHALLYATPAAEAVGSTRVWRDLDQLTNRILGGIGGETDAVVNPPEGFVFRIPRGSGLVVQTHYLNASDQTITGKATLDVTVSDADPESRVASWFFVTLYGVSVGPGSKTVTETQCTLLKDIRLLQFSNHMHRFGATQTTWIDEPGGGTREIKVDPVWDPEWGTNANFEVRPTGNPLVLPAGTTVHTRCTWGPTGGAVVGYPDEMCMFYAIVDRPSDVLCVDGVWVGN